MMLKIGGILKYAGKKFKGEKFYLGLEFYLDIVHHDWEGMALDQEGPGTGAVSRVLAFHPSVGNKERVGTRARI